MCGNSSINFRNICSWNATRNRYKVDPGGSIVINGRKYMANCGYFTPKSVEKFHPYLELVGWPPCTNPLVNFGMKMPNPWEICLNQESWKDPTLFQYTNVWSTKVVERSCPQYFRIKFGEAMSICCIHQRKNTHTFPSWWFQPIWKILVKNWIISPGRDEPPPSYCPPKFAGH